MTKPFKLHLNIFVVEFLPNTFSIGLHIYAHNKYKHYFWLNFSTRSLLYFEYEWWKPRYHQTNSFLTNQSIIIHFISSFFNRFFFWKIIEYINWMIDESLLNISLIFLIYFHCSNFHRSVTYTNWVITQIPFFRILGGLSDQPYPSWD